MINRQLYIMKFQSSRLKKFNYNININYNKALENGEIIALSDNQLLRTIRDVVVKHADDKEKIKQRILNRDLLEKFYTDLKKIKRNKNIKNKEQLIKSIKQNIIDMCFIPEYITIVMNHDKHYDYLYNNGLIINFIEQKKILIDKEKDEYKIIEEVIDTKRYFRLSTSAGQGRVSTVTFCSNDILLAVNKILDNGRDKTVKFSPSKFNAYKGVYGSATKVVTSPKFCVIPDYESEDEFKVNFVTETEGEQDDLIEVKNIKRIFNRFDGQGLISPKMAKIWANDLELDYVPAEFCIRQSYIKGMLAVFDIHDYCKKKNNNNYMIKTIYKDKNGNHKYVDLRNCDVIISESQFKLWQSFPSKEVYENNCEKNNLKWGVTLYTDKELKNTLMYNYQFLQAMNIKKEYIPELCKDFVNWIKGVNSENIWYTLLFLMGVNVTESSLKQYFKSQDNWWVKSLIVNHNLIRDKYVQQKIYELIKKRVENGCIGRICLEGNNQTLVSDPYAMMQHVCGQKVVGLLNKNEYYSNYWNNKNVKQIIGTRPPLTYRSEVTKLNLVNRNEHSIWYKYLYGGIIVNVHGHECDNWAGSDWDYDFLSSTSNNVLLDSVYDNEYPVIYNAPKPQKFHFTDKDLYISDKFSFGSIIGAITNKSTSGHALLEYLKEIYGINSREYQTVLNRVKMCTKLQSAQIDKAKIGREVKGIPKIWVDRKYIDKLKSSNEEKKFLKRIMLDRYPYFFIHLYKNTKNKYKKYIEEYNLSSIHKFGIDLNTLIQQDNKSNEEINYTKMYYKYMPIIDSNSVMNNICKYIENINFDIKNKIKQNTEDISFILMRNTKIFNQELYNDVLKEYKDFKKQTKFLKTAKFNIKKNKYDITSSQETDNFYIIFKNKMDEICSNTYDLVDCLIRIFYIEYKNDNKSLLWNTYGDIILDNIKDKNQHPILFPIPDKNGNIIYLNDKFSLKEVKFK